MAFSIRLHSIKCLEESDESSAADEPFVLVTSADLRPPGPGIAPPRTFRYGEWDNFDEGESLVLIGEPPFWGMDSEPQNVANVDDVCFVVTVMEHDHGNLDAYRGVVETAATASLASTLALGRPTRVTRLLDAIRSAIGLLDLPSLDDHVGTKELRLDNSDLIPLGSIKDKTLEIDGGDEGKWELTFRIAHHQRNSFVQGTQLAAVTRAADRMELWAVGHDGVLRGNWFQARWHGWYMLPGEQFGLGTHLAAVTRHADHMEVWAVGQDGMMRGVWFDGAKWQGWYVLPGATFPAGAPLAALSRGPDHMEVWSVDVNGAVRGKWFDGAWHPENAWYTLEGAQFPLGVHLAAVSRSAEHMELWVVADDRPILGNRFDGTSPPPQWQGWYPLQGEVFSPGTDLAAIRRKGTDDMHVFATDLNQHLRDFWFEGITPRGWYQAGIESFAIGAPIAAVSRHPDRIELWTVGLNDVVQDDPFEKTQWKGWFALDGAQFDQNGDLAAVSRDEGHMEVWGVGQGIIRGNAFFDGAWHGWYPLIWSFEG